MRERKEEERAKMVYIKGNITVPYLQAPNFFSPLANQGSMMNTARNLV